MPIVRTNGLETAYEVLGAGPPLVALHGATLSGDDWLGPQLDWLAARFRVHLPDARGHGATTWDAAEGFTSDELVADLLGLADALGLEAFHLLGFSLGGMTALRFAATYPHRVRSLVVVGASPEREPRASVGRRLMDPDRIERDDPRWAHDLARRHDPGQGEGAWRRLLPAIAADIESQALLTPAELREIACPALVACGDRDPFMPVSQAWGLKRALPRGRLLIAPDCGHEVLTERPAVFSAAMADLYGEMEATR